jgi:hypothetical protein
MQALVSTLTFRIPREAGQHDPSLLPAHGVQFGHTEDVSGWGGYFVVVTDGRSEYVDRIRGETEQMPRCFHTRFAAVFTNADRFWCVWDADFGRTLPDSAQKIALFSLWRHQTLDQRSGFEFLGGSQNKSINYLQNTASGILPSKCAARTHGSRPTHQAQSPHPRLNLSRSHPSALTPTTARRLPPATPPRRKRGINGCKWIFVALG